MDLILVLNEKDFFEQHKNIDSDIPKVLKCFLEMLYFFRAKKNIILLNFFFLGGGGGEGGYPCFSDIL